MAQNGGELEGCRVLVANADELAGVVGDAVLSGGDQVGIGRKVMLPGDAAERCFRGGGVRDDGVVEQGRRVGQGRADLVAG